MVKQYAVEEAGEGFAAAVEEAEQGERVEVTRRGRPVAVLVSLGENESQDPSRASFWAAYEEVRGDYDLDALAIDPDAIFAGIRDPSPGRGFTL